ncbi:MAG: 3-hydroxyacyl-ACP dehydratase FabZ [Myxococcota bacterium]
MNEGTLDIDAILRILPHRYPFVLVDRVIGCDPGKRIVCIKNVTFNEPHFAGHFPGQPVMPGVLIVEALAQAGALLAASARPTGRPHAQAGFDAARQIIYLLGIDKVRFRAAVRPGDRLELEVVPLRIGSKVWKMRGVARVEGRTVAEAELLATIADRDANAPG